MASALITACDEVVTAINAHDWGEREFTARRVYRPASDLEDVASLCVEVCLPGRTRERVSRAHHQDTFTISVGIQKQLNPTSKQADADDLMDFADQVLDLMTNRSWTCGSLKSIEERPTLHPARYDLDNVFCRVIVLTFSARGLINV